MFDVGSSEILLIIAVSVILIDPKKMPVTIRTIKKYYGYMVDFKQSIFDDLDSDVRYIKGDDGLRYKSYSTPETCSESEKSIGVSLEEKTFDQSDQFEKCSDSAFMSENKSSVDLEDSEENTRK